MCETAAAYHRHDSSDRAWKEHPGAQTAGRPRQSGSPGAGPPPLSNAVFRVLRTGAPWRDLPTDYGDDCAVPRRFRHWRKKGVWAQLPEAVIR